MAEITRTVLGYRDITSSLAEDSLEGIEKRDVIRAITVERIKEENHHGTTTQIGYFFHPDYRINGRIFPQDEILEQGKTIDIIVANWQAEIKRGFSNLDVQPYHDFHSGEQFKVKISRIEDGRDPSFKMFCNIPGFLRYDGNPDVYKKVVLGSKVLVGVILLHQKGSRLHVITKPLKLI